MANFTQAERPTPDLEKTSAPPSSCVCYIANEGYLFQTVASAIQARGQTSAATDIVIIDFTEHPGSESSIMRDVCARERIIYVSRSPKLLDGLHIINARLFLPEVLPLCYEEILYIDGDTQVPAELEPLMAFRPEPGHLCAARDPMVYLNRLGLLEENYKDEVLHFGDDYVNSGVMRVSRSDLSQIASVAIPILRRGGRDLHFQDQSVINNVTSGRRQFLSFGWNFPGFVLGYGLESIAKPRIVHFMSNPRPWQGSFRPWGSAFHRPYRELVQRYPELAPFRGRMSLGRTAAYKVKQVLKMRSERPIWSSDALKTALRDLEADTAI